MSSRARVWVEVGENPETRHRLLNDVVDTLVAYGVTEPMAGSNVAKLRTTAEPVTGADGNFCSGADLRAMAGDGEDAEKKVSKSAAAAPRARSGPISFSPTILVHSRNSPGCPSAKRFP